MIDRKNHASRLCGYSPGLESGAEEWCCPVADQSGERVAAWLRDHGSPGEAVIVFFKQQALCQFRLDEIEAWRGHRVHLVEHGAFDERGFAVDRPRNISLRVLRPSVLVIEAAVRGVTLQHCKPVNERELSATEEVLASRMRRTIVRDS
jgi:hypothetical protein